MSIVIGIENYVSIWDILSRYGIYTGVYTQITFLFILGTILGSFINVVSIRIADGRDWVAGHSECDNCHHILKAWDLIPILSYLSTLGKCRYCGKRISTQHIISEILCGVLMVLSKGEIITMIILGVLLFEALFDYKNKLIITTPVYIASIVTLIYNFYTLGIDYLNLRFWIILLLFVIIAIFNIVYNEEHMGLGDFDIIYLFIIYGGLYFSILSVMVASIIGISVYLAKLILKTNKQREIPFVPYLLIGFIFSLEFGGTVWSILS